MSGKITDNEKIACVDRWLSDVSEASKRWSSAKSAQQASESVVAYLETIKARVRGVPADLEERMDEAIAANRANAEKLAARALEQASIESGFHDVLERVFPAEVAEAWRLRCLEGRTWLQCSMTLHYNRQHLERLSKAAKIAVYDEIPERYRRECHGG